MSTVTSSTNKLSVDTHAQDTTPTTVQNYDPTFLTLQHDQCAMCGQMKSTHPEGCHRFGEVVYTTCEIPNHASLFCHRIKKDIKKVCNNTFPSKSNRNNKRDRDHKSENLTNVVNINLTNQTPVKINRIKRIKENGNIKN